MRQAILGIYHSKDNVGPEKFPLKHPLVKFGKEKYFYASHIQHWPSTSLPRRENNLDLYCLKLFSQSTLKTQQEMSFLRREYLDIERNDTPLVWMYTEADTSLV